MCDQITHPTARKKKERTLVDDRVDFHLGTFSRPMARLELEPQQAGLLVGRQGVLHRGGVLETV